MGPLYLFSAVARHNQWLSVRQATIAGNIANANTKGFKALDVDPFEKVVDSARLAMAATHAAHIGVPAAAAAGPELRAAEAWEVTHSGNSVSLEQELIKSSEVGRAYRLNANVVKAFHRMLLASAKG
ncbi:MAG TPA: flagellar basal body rod protein FlgB [Hyphomicrobiaceae bacterium]|jgi:flagellar basal-body rod protein FlgB|nr:flagellar basal body rod protein FlgB [Hyphomicrobiaceae bacterium]